MKTIKRTKGMPLSVNYIAIIPELHNTKQIAYGFTTCPIQKPDSDVLWFVDPECPTSLQIALHWSTKAKLGTDFGTNKSAQVGTRSGHFCCLGGVWFVREEDRLEALKICGIDKAFQEKCAKYGLGGA